jgi:hypothetical protein
MKTNLLKIGISLFAIALILVRVNWPDIKIDTITIGLFVVALLPWFTLFLESAELPGGWKLKFREIQQEQEKQKNEIESLKFLVGHFVTDHEFVHLEKLAKNTPFPFRQGPETHFFKNELMRLRALGLINGHKNKGIRSLLEYGGDVKDHFYITEIGRKYLALRADMEESESSSLKAADN